MDFNDEDFYSQKRRRKNDRSNLLTAFVSAIIGGLIVLMLMPTFVNSGIIDLTPKGGVNPPSQTINNQTPTNVTSGKQIQVDVNSAIVDATEKVKPAVVGVVNIQKQTNFWTNITKSVEAGVGSGVVFDKRSGKAYIVTNNHVIEGANNVEVALADGKRVPAKVLGADELTDLAVISIDEKYADAVATFGDSTNLKAGEPAIAIGNPLGLKFSQSVTVGVVSSPNRTIDKDLDGDGQPDWETDVIQTDAAINPGNSGGALLNINGDVIGINSAKIAESGVEGLGFAIPISEAKPIIDQLIQYGKVKRPYMGITQIDLHSVSQADRVNVLKLPESVNDGIVIYDVSRFGPAYLAGLKRLDVIVKLDDQPINSSSDLRKFLYKQKKVGDKMKVSFYRDGNLQSIELTLTEVPDQNRR
ncbi:trypsin-like peptidase domain-containing protein [Tepidibacillus infernus]|uniref:Serine protease n=1 Tax=Tepidibacillus decaturensis TaxID=1413211 RepID=A0A135L747_9BACI|nr:MULTISPECIES: trypsin-like peptidase domain-containing protein [Tepidibacillus]KXG44759.1 serine protease [Tepidibacillus decaturensis]GBF11522.1 serine protease Do-like HtrB [Tepidibacillus sp. HK-1]